MSGNHRQTPTPGSECSKRIHDEAGFLVSLFIHIFLSNTREELRMGTKPGGGRKNLLRKLRFKALRRLTTAWCVHWMNKTVKEFNYKSLYYITVFSDGLVMCVCATPLIHIAENVFNHFLTQFFSFIISSLFIQMKMFLICDWAWWQVIRDQYFVIGGRVIAFRSRGEDLFLERFG